MASSQNLSFMIKATKVMLFLMKIISSFEVLWPNVFIRLINEYIRDVWEKKKHVSSTVCYDHHFCSSNFHLVSQFSFDWSRTALIVVSGMIPIRDFRKAQVLAFIECFFVPFKKNKLFNAEKFSYASKCSCYRYIRKVIFLLGKRFGRDIASQ